ncbi:MAG: hypothetical protein G3M70_11225 [Candidatus Nitronauta litoralis]|uniref:Uncharacterized protein n=1 Tax=Candidatus Nitronauta litoralis TaxID=2705533 RepID=A0A7T0BWW8_9BACT|nr:MAG: hypothetical protein G3M70_11225 [Candidatus Nitronauta litoralis]
MASLINVELWAGLPHNNQRQTVARLRPVTGEDEAALLDTPTHLLPAEKATFLLTRLLDSIGSLKPINEEHVRQLTTGDRERLLFTLYSITFSEEVDLIARCPFEECGTMSEITLPLSNLIHPEQTENRKDSFQFFDSTQDHSLTIRFRMPTGFDQEKIGRRFLKKPDKNLELELVKACILEISDQKGNTIPHQSLLKELKPHLESAWSGLDPASDPFSKVHCPECGREYTAVLDAFSLFSTRLENGDDIFDQVHRLARVYHWSEREVLGLTFERRQRYLEIVDSEARPS